VAAVLHLLELGPRYPPDHLAWRVIDLVVAAIIAGVVVSHFAGELLRQGDFSFPDELLDKLGGVYDFVVSPELGVLVPEGIEAVRAVGENLFDAVLFQDFDEAPRHRLEEILVADPACGLAVAELFFPQNGKFYPRLFEDLDRCQGSFFAAVVKSSRTADVIEKFRVGMFRDPRHLDPLSPRVAIFLADAPRVALGLHPFEGAIQLAYPRSCPHTR